MSKRTVAPRVTLAACVIGLLGAIDAPAGAPAPTSATAPQAEMKPESKRAIDEAKFKDTQKRASEALARALSAGPFDDAGKERIAKALADAHIATLILPTSTCRFSLSTTLVPWLPTSPGPLQFVHRVALIAGDNNTPGAACTIPSNKFYVTSFVMSLIEPSNTPTHMFAGVTCPPNLPNGTIAAASLVSNQCWINSLSPPWDDHFQTWVFDTTNATFPLPAGWSTALTVTIPPLDVVPNAPQSSNPLGVAGLACVGAREDPNFVPVNGYYTGGYSDTPGVHHMSNCWPVDPTVCQPLAPTQPLLSNLRAWWKMDGNPYDQMGISNFTGGSFSAAGFVNGAAVAGQTTIQVPNNAAINLGQADFTFDFWIKVPPDSLSPLSLNHSVIILDKLSWQSGYKVEITTAGMLKITFKGAGQSAFTYTLPHILLGQHWWFVGISLHRNSNTGGHIYVWDDSWNPSPAVSTVFNTTQYSDSLNNSHHLSMAKHFGTTTDPPMLDEVEIFDRALTKGQLFLIRNAFHSGKCPFELSKSGATPP